MQSLIELNEQAVQYMETGRLQEATSILSEALSSLQTTMDDNSVVLEETKKTVCDSLDDQRTAHANSTHPSKTFSLLHDLEEGDEDYIYRTPVVPSSLPEDEELDEYMMSILVVFNLAISNHLQAIEAKKAEDSGVSSKSSPRALDRFRVALKLYELSFCMQLKGDCELNVTHILALVNNCGQIYKQLNCTKKADRFFQHMLSTLLLMIENGEAQEVDELDGFIWNASRMILSDPVVALAA